MEPATPGPLAVVTLDADGRVLALSRSAEELLGYDRVATVGACLGELLVPTRLRHGPGDPLRPLFDACTGADGEGRCRLPVSRSDGDEFPADLLITPLPAGGYTAVVGALPPDVGERQASEWFHRTLVGRSPVVVMVFDLNGDWRWSSPAAVALHGPGAPSRDRLAAIVHHDDTGLVRTLFTAAVNAPRRTGGGPSADAETVEVRLRAPDHDEEWRLYALTVQNLADEPAVEGIVIYAIDITRAWATEIRRGLEERDRALAEVATLKTEFVAAASHELRTPLTSILTFSQMLSEEPDTPPEQQQVALEAIARNANRTLKIIDDLLTLAGLEGGTLPLALRAVHLPDLIREAVDAFAGAAARAGVTVELLGNPTGPMLRVDPVRFRQAVEALLSVVAAAHFAGNQIDVEVTFAAPNWTVRVGSPAELRAGGHLFTTGDRGAGNALSLLIARAIVSRHGGQLATPNTGHSDAFAISLPVRPNLPEGDG